MHLQTGNLQRAAKASILEILMNNYIHPLRLVELRIYCGSILDSDDGRLSYSQIKDFKNKRHVNLD